ncbi:MAG: flagellar regulator YcgR PilZN domain-containing protein [Pseudomonadota bacterium]
MPSFKAYKVSLLGTRHQNEYEVASELERYRLLREISKRVEPVTVHLGRDEEDKDQFFVTSIVEVDRKRNLMHIERAPTEAFNRLTLNSGELQCATRLDRVPIEFALTSPKPSTFKEYETFAVPLPKVLVRMQRRAYYRLAIASSTHAVAKLAVRMPKSNEVKTFTALITDVSLGGIGCDLPQQIDINIEPGLLFEHCALHLPEMPPIEVHLEIRVCFQRHIGNLLGWHLGFMFIDMPESTANQIQKYIYLAERERIKDQE